MVSWMYRRFLRAFHQRIDGQLYRSFSQMSPALAHSPACARANYQGLRPLMDSSVEQGIASFRQGSALLEWLVIAAFAGLILLALLNMLGAGQTFKLGIGVTIAIISALITLLPMIDLHRQLLGKTSVRWLGADITIYLLTFTAQLGVVQLLAAAALSIDSMVSVIAPIFTTLLAACALQYHGFVILLEKSAKLDLDSEGLRRYLSATSGFYSESVLENLLLGELEGNEVTPEALMRMQSTPEDR